LRNNPESGMAKLASVGSNVEALRSALSRGEFRVRRLSREELTELMALMAQIKVDYLWWRP
jgi:hypothetical protein